MNKRILESLENIAKTTGKVIGGTVLTAALIFSLPKKANAQNSYTDTKVGLVARGWHYTPWEQPNTVVWYTDSLGRVPGIVQDSTGSDANANKANQENMPYFGPIQRKFQQIIGQGYIYGGDHIADFEDLAKNGNAFPRQSGIEEKGLGGKVSEEFRVSPNPSTGRFTSTQDGKLYTPNGRFVGEVIAGHEENVNHSGIYFIKTVPKNGQVAQTKRVVVIR